MNFEWDDAKSKANKKKHGLAFDEVRELFLSCVDYLEIYNWEHSQEEERFISIGPIQEGIVLVVWTERVKRPSGSSAPGGQRPGRRLFTDDIWRGND